MEESLSKSLESKGYNCACECNFHQIKKLEIREESIPNLRGEKRIGIIKRLVVTDRKIEDRDKSIKKIETEAVIFKKYWYESLGMWGELIVILEKSERIINNIEEIENNLDNIIKFIPTKYKKLNEYNKKIILIGIKSLFELGKISYWDKIVYFIYGTNETGKSAGVPLLLAFYSAFLKMGVPRDLSATGEINTEDGSIKGIGGLKEKFVCCMLSNKEIGSLVLPKENHEYVLEISDAYFKRFIKTREINFHPVNNWNDLVNLLSQWNK